MKCSESIRTSIKKDEESYSKNIATEAQIAADEKTPRNYTRKYDNSQGMKEEARIHHSMIKKKETSKQ